MITSRQDGRMTSHRPHRIIYEALHGPIPDGLQIDHLCRNKVCCNPHHLEPVTARENILRSNGQGAVNARKTHCIHGHPLEGDNLVIGLDGARRCLVCLRDRGRRHQQKRRAAEAILKGPTRHCDDCGADIEARRFGPHVSAHRKKARAAAK